MNPEKLKFKNQKLKIMHITDTHLEEDNTEQSLFLIGVACDKEKPDVVIATGDNVTNNDNADIVKERIDKFMRVFEDRGIPVAVTFGNHDSEVGALSREELMRCYNSYSCSLGNYDGPDGGTYNVPVYATDNDSIRFNLWIMDSNDYDDEGHYGCVLPHQVEWYKKRSDEITAQNNGSKVYSMVFQHMIVADVYDALKKTDKHRLYSFSHMYNKADYYMFDPDNVNYGTLNETPCSGYHNFGQFEAMVEKGDVLAMFTGHDHTNAFGVKHKGIDIVNSLSTRFKGNRFETQYGYRIIEVSENDTSRYTSRNERWYRMFSRKDISAYRSLGNSLAHTVAKQVTYKGIIQRFHTFTGRKFTQIVTGRKTTYPD